MAAELSRMRALLDEARAEVETELRLAQASVGDVARWLCIVPAWSPVLAARCGFPGWVEGQEEVLLDAWRAEGLVEFEASPLTIDETGQFLPPRLLFWMPRQERNRWLTHVLAEDGRDGLRALAGDIAQRVKAQPHDQHVPSTTWRWAMLAVEACSPTPMSGGTFEHEIERALSANKPDEAWLWIEALQRVAEVVPGEATLLQQRAVRQLALFDRQRTDLALLRDYLPRPALFEAYRSLLNGPDEAWALHYLGGGGVGKTMLMRALTSGTAAHRPPGIDIPPTITARIDFDHIDPDYPARRPGLLFAHLAEELRLKDEGLRASEGFSLLFRKIGLLHERTGPEGTSEAEIDDMLDVFAWACTELARSRGARVVLLLDTCEELARLGVDGRLPESVERTFDLLARLHTRLPALRVVFCGRRPLASTYAGDAAVAPGLPARPWLALQRVHAFSEEEAHAYLSKVGVPAVLVDPILMRSGAAASSSALGLPADGAVPRYSPFSLSVYAAWVARQPGLTPAAILDDPVDHFVRIRILDRIHNNDVRRLLPHVALLGRFDEATLRACVDLRPDVADAVLRELGSQEWIDRQAGGYYAVEQELRSRLLHYFAAEAPGEIAAARARVLPVLRDLLERGGTSEVPDEAVVQAITELLPGDRQALLETWRVLDARIVSGGHAAWGTRVLGRLLADEDGLASPVVDPGVWAACVTTYGECVMRTQGAAAAVDLWPRAWDRAAHLADPVERGSVRARLAAGGLVAASPQVDQAGEVDRWAMRLFNVVTDVDRVLASPVQMAPVIAALMHCADDLDRRGDPFAPAEPMLERVAAALVGVGHAPSRALALTCVGRLAARRQDADAAHKRLVEALATITAAHDRELPPCLQWPAGLDAASWVVLEALRGLAGLEPVEETLARFTTIPPVRSATALNRIEALRLRLSAAMRVSSGRHEPIGEDTARSVRHARDEVRSDDVAPVESAGQALVPPRAVALAVDLVERGQPADGLRLLGELTSLATSARNTVVATAAEAARVDAVTRLRLGEHGRLSRQLGDGLRSLDVEGRERARAFIGDEGGFNPESTAAMALEAEAVTSRGAAHAVWRARRAFSEQERADLARAGASMLALGPEGEGEWVRACVSLDLVECAELGGDVGAHPASRVPPSPEDWWSRHPALPAHALRLWVRSAALGVSPGGPTTQLVRRVGVRRAALIALEEGELLALRLPAPALRLLAFALTWFEDAGDVFGTWQVQALLALTRVRAGVPREAVDLSGLRAAHDAMTAGGPDRAPAGVPPWDAVVANVSLPLPDSASAEWTPWLHRLIALHHWVDAGVRPEVLFARPDQVPLELRGWPITTGGGTTSETAIAPAQPRLEGMVPRPASVDRPTGSVARPGPLDLGSGSAPALPPVSAPVPAPEAVTRTPRMSTLLWVLVAVAIVFAVLAIDTLWNTRTQPPLLQAPGPSHGEPIDSASPAIRPTVPDDAPAPSAPAPSGSESSAPEPSGSESTSAAVAVSPPPGSAASPGKAAAPGRPAERPAFTGPRDAQPVSEPLLPPPSAPTRIPIRAGGTALAAPAFPTGRLAPTETDAMPVWLGVLAAALLLAAVASWQLIQRWRAQPSDAAVGGAPIRAWQAAVTLTGGDASFGRSGVLDATVSLHDEAGQVATTAPLRMRRADAYAGLDALRQPPSGTVLSTALREASDVGRLDLLLSSRASWPCWEALLWSGTVDDGRIGPPVVRHVPASRAARVFKPAEGRVRVALVADSPSEARQATYAWEASVRAERVALAQASAEQIRAGQSAPGIGLVHVVASTVETPQGLFAEVHGRDELEGESLESLHVDRGTLFDASQLAHVFPEASCVLLQPPRRASLELTPAGREACATARLFGAALAEQGVPIVVVLPPLDGELGAHLVRLLGRRVPALAAGMPFDTFGFVMRTRQMVFEHAQKLLPRDAAIELALHVAVYVA